MILSVSRRTDIPAFYPDWFFNRLQEGYALVRNPMNPRQVSRIRLTPDVVDCIVFWTKDPSRILERMDQLSEYPSYFMITINGYGRGIERAVPDVDVVIEAFHRLSDRIGRKKTIWRYDPIIFNDQLDADFHCGQFGRIASALEGYTERCVISFVDLYRKNARGLKEIGIVPAGEVTKLALGRDLARISRQHQIKISACCEPVGLAGTGIEPAHCIDAELISEILGSGLKAGKDRNQRAECGCAASIDLGAYNTCPHGCLYCYANASGRAVQNNFMAHDPRSPLLTGWLNPGDKVTERPRTSCR
jgi:hypothetical protein